MNMKSSKHDLGETNDKEVGSEYSTVQITDPGNQDVTTLDQRDSEVSEHENRGRKHRKSDYQASRDRISAVANRTSGREDEQRNANITRLTYSMGADCKCVQLIIVVIIVASMLSIRFNYSPLSMLSGRQSDAGYRPRRHTHVSRQKGESSLSRISSYDLADDGDDIYGETAARWRNRRRRIQKKEAMKQQFAERRKSRLRQLKNETEREYSLEGDYQEFNVSREYTDYTGDTSYEQNTPNKQTKYINFPIVFIPGLGGSKLEVKEDDDDWKLLWMNQGKVITDIEYLVEALSLKYDNKTKKSSDAPHFKVRVKDFGKMDGTDFLDETIFGKITDIFDIGRASYSKKLTEKLEKLGYIADVNLVSAAYDFRISTRHQTEFMKRLQRLIEDTYRFNANKKVIILTHSLGGLMAYHLLSKMNTDWKRKYIHTFVSMNTPWCGSVKAFYMFTNGFNFNVELLDKQMVKSLISTWETMVEVFPLNFKSNRIILQTPDKNFTASDIPGLVKEMYPGFASTQYEAAIKQYEDLKHPEVHTVTVVSIWTELGTPVKLEYSDFPNGQPTVIRGKGDGSVSRDSQTYAYHRWSKHETMGEMVQMMELPQSSHMDIMKDKRILQLVEALNHITRHGT